MKKSAEKTKIKEGFYLHVDGKQYGPFLKKHRRNFAYLFGRMGVSFVPHHAINGWAGVPKKKPQIPQEESRSLLEDIGFQPKPKHAARLSMADK